MPPNLSASEALERLVEGNARFRSNVLSIDRLARQLQRTDLAQGQRPFAIVLGCSDSRAPAELVFDSGLGELFVIRVAGNVVSPSQIGSVEFAAERFGVRLVVVMGHTRCGAIDATLETIEGNAPPSTNLMSIVRRVRPAVETVREAAPEAPREEVLHLSVRANVRVSVEHLRHGSGILEALIEREGLLVMGAEYDVETGAVTFFDV
ncbi:MAG TPA: carbonic anhydrase [Anaeromyxobacteraceae bacterium]|nr:carbonic anhydrase [Anaeromyxobacteraceae bacterium]